MKRVAYAMPVVIVAGLLTAGWANAKGCNGVVDQMRWGCAAWDNNNGPQYPYYKGNKPASPQARPAPQVAPRAPSAQVNPAQNSRLIRQDGASARSQNSRLIGDNGSGARPQSGIVAGGGGNAAHTNRSGIVAGGGGNAVNQNKLIGDGGGTMRRQ